MANKLFLDFTYKTLSFIGKKNIAKLDKMAKKADKCNKDLLFKTIQENKTTEYGKKYKFDEIKSIDDFKNNVPFSTYEDYEPYIKRMIDKKEKNLITNYPVVQYVRTSGSIGDPKYIPVTNKEIELYKKYGANKIIYLAEDYLKKNKHKSLNRAKFINMIENTDEYMADGTPCGNISGTISKKYKNLFSMISTTPFEVMYPNCKMDTLYLKTRFALEEPDISIIVSTFMSHISNMLSYIENNWEILCYDIETGTINKNIKIDSKAYNNLIKLIKPNPKRADELRAIFREGFECQYLKKIWPGMDIISSIGTGSFETYTNRVKNVASNVAYDYSYYAASEGIFAIARHVDKPEFLLLPDSCFYEFLDVDEIDESKTLMLDELEVGKEYEIIITNPCGFYRYRINDVIKVLGYQNKCPLITFSYRKGQVLNIAGEKTTEEQINATIFDLSKEIGTMITDYVIYEDESVTPSRYSVIIESKDKIDIKKKHEFGRLFDRLLCKNSFEYEESRLANEISESILNIQKPKTHLLWRNLKIKKGASLNQVKPIRLLDSPAKYKFFTDRIAKI